MYWAARGDYFNPGVIYTNHGKDLCMSDALIVGLFTGIVSLVGIFVSAKATREEVTHKLDINQQVMRTEMNYIKSDVEEMRSDIRVHNHYAELFNKNIPVMNEKLSAAENRMQNIEADIKFYHRRTDE